MKVKELRALINEIVEQAIEEATYPEGFDVVAFKALPSFRARLQYVKARLPKIAQGSARAVFDIDPQTVLKVALNPKGKAQNDVESNVGNYGHYPIAQVFETGDDGAWLEMEKATKVTRKLFKQISGISLGEFDYMLTYVNALDNGKNSLSKPDYYEKLIDNEFVNSVLDLMRDHGMPPADLSKSSSWGVVNREGKPTLVLIDYGLTWQVWNDFYARKRNGY